jgi:DNA-binding response OmpR family regulator
LSEAEGAALVIVDGLAPGMAPGYQELEPHLTAPLLLLRPALETGGRVVAIPAPLDQATLLKQVRELVAEAEPKGVQVGDLVMDLEARRVQVGGRPVTLTRIEFNLLAYLAGRLGKVAKYDELLEAVWGYPHGQGDRKIVINCVVRLRRQLGDDADRPAYVVNIPGIGYRLRNPQQWEEAMMRGGEED